MKSKLFIKTLILLLICELNFTSCQKQNLEPTEETKIADSTILKKVLSWLDKKNKPNARSIDSSVAYIKQNLIGNELRLEKFNDKERLIIIPLKDDFKTLNVTTEKTFKNLVIIENEKGEYRRGNIIEIIPKDQKFNKVPENLISKVYNNKSNELNGTFSILTITNKFIYELGYTKNKLTYTKYLSKKPGKSGGRTNDNAGRTNQMCIDWYWVTTYYNADGSTTENWQYLYRTCNENLCYVEPAGRNIDKDKISYKVNCGGDDVGNPTTEPLTLITVDTVIDVLLIDSCLKHTKQAITNPNLKNFLTKLYQGTFTGFGNVANMEFQQGPVYAEMRPTLGKTDYNPATNTYIITLNPDVANTVSRESVGGAIMHEILHAFIFIYEPNLQDNLAQHTAMVEGWSRSASLILQQAFGLSVADANALAIFGTGKAIYGNGVTPPAEWDAFLQNTYGLTPGEVQNIGTDYYTKVKGTICN